MKGCGSCTMCCKLLGIPEIKKPAGAWCSHCAVGQGCRVYDIRPQSCRDFECLWLQSQGRENPRERMVDTLRPDRCKVVLSPSTNEKVVAASVDPGRPNAWREPAIREIIDALVTGNMHVVVGWGTTIDKILLSRDRATGKVTEKAITMTPPDADGMQWSLEK